MKVLIDIPDQLYKDIKNGIWCANNIISNAIEIGTPIPEKATKGQVMQIIFPNVDTNFTNILDLNLWWKSRYQKEDKNE